MSTTSLAPAEPPDPERPLETAVVRVATAGSVDDGKSTLIGRLLYDCKALFTDQLEQVEQASLRRGFQRTELALVTDGLRAEREQGITIDVAWRYFATTRRRFILADTPGHVQYTRNMVTGASIADVAIVLIDAERGATDQTHRHLLITATLAVPRVIVAVNKMDRVGFSEARFDELLAEARRIFSAGGGVGELHGVPISALRGDNLVVRSADTPYYAGPTLLTLLEEAHGAARDHDRPGRLAIQWVIRPQAEAFHHYRGFAGRIAEGSLRPGDAVTLQPAGTQTRIVRIDVGGEARELARAGESVVVHLADEVDAGRGDLVAAGEVTPVREDFAADVCWLAAAPLVPGARLQVKHTTRRVRGVVEQIEHERDVTTGELRPATRLAQNALGRIRLRLSGPLCVEPYERSRALGSLLLIDEQSGETVGAAMVRG